MIEKEISKYLLISLVLIFLSPLSIAQDLYSKCIPNCTISPPSRSLQNMAALDMNGEMFVTGYGSTLYNQGGFIALLDSMSIPIWNQEYVFELRDTVIGPIDTIRIDQNRFLRGSGMVGDNLFCIATSNDSTLYKISNGAITFLRKGRNTSTFSLFNKFGVVQWSTSLITDTFHNYLTKVADSDSKILFSGVLSGNYFQNSPVGDQAFVCLDSSGTLIWSKIIVNTSSKKINKTVGYFNKGFLVMSNDASSIYLTQLDINGNIQWNKNYAAAGTLYGNDLIVADDSTIYILAANNTGPFSPTLIKLNNIGQILWSNSYGSTQPVLPTQLISNSGNRIKLIYRETTSSPFPVTAVEVDSNGNVVDAAVIFQNISNSNINPPSFYGLFLTFITKQDQYYLSAIKGDIDFPMLGYSYDYFKLVRLDSLYNNCEFLKYPVSISLVLSSVIESGLTELDSTISASLLPYNLGSTGANLPISNYCNSSVGQMEYMSSDSFSIYPNPTFGKIEIKMQSSDATVLFDLYDLQGKLKFKMELSGDNRNSIIHLPESLSQGLYIVKIDNGYPVFGKLLLLK